MNQAKEVDAFVHQCFDMYGLSFEQFFGEVVDEEEDENGFVYGGTYKELPLVIGEDIDMELLGKAATTLGVSIESLLKMDEKSVQCWYKKFPYFSLNDEFKKARVHSFQYFASSEQMTIDSIFKDDYHPDKYRRYKGGIAERLIDLLKSYNTVMPGCYHEGCEIKRLSIETDNFTHFKKIKELTEAYLSMVDRARKLFYKLWNDDLPDDEIKEYNFLVSVLGMRDVGYSPSKPIYYELARKFAPIYKKESYSDYASYIMYRGADFPAVYTCKEFYDYPELAERMAQEFPDIKADIGKMAIFAKNFLCTFVWSDEPEPSVEASFDEYLVDVLHSFGDDVPSWYHRVYVPKSEDELHGDEKYIAICKSLSAPASQGGLKLPIPEYKVNADEACSTRRIIARVAGIVGGSPRG